MNDLYLIGNGFDLAHGLKTSYNDFLLWYLNESTGNAELSIFDDALLEINGQNSSFIPSSSPSIQLLLEHSKQSNMVIKFKHDFFKKIVENYRDYKWVDIEYEYYMGLVQIYRDFEKTGALRSNFHFGRLKPLNDCFELIKKKLVEYLSTVKVSSDLKNNQINEILFESTGFYQVGEPEYLANVANGMVGSPQEKLFVCFNYTNTLELYLKPTFSDINSIYIHGELNEESNPTIFGYGDEMDPHYEKIENLNNNEFLRNIKSFGYFRTNNYQKVMRFIEGEGREFTVKILGHSCGLSDRILLNSIFEHPNCKWIKIYYYEKSPTENDYFEKTQEISRHFKASMKGEMRKKIVSFENSTPMPQSKKE